jgi:hypothetical protein
MVWDDYYGPLSPTNIIMKLEQKLLKIEELPAFDVPPELERAFEAYRALERTARRLALIHNSR